MRLKYDFHINAYVVMPEHVHLLASEPKRAILAKAIPVNDQGGFESPRLSFFGGMSFVRP